MPRLSIVIVTYNSSKEITACLRSLTDAAPGVEHELLIVDNASSDGTADTVRAQWPSARVIDSGGNIGFARANNLAMRNSESELVLLLNPDTVVPPHAVDRLVGVMDRTPDAAIAGPRLVDGRGRAEVSFGRMIGPLAELRQKVLVVGQDRGLPVLSRHVERMTRRAQDVDWVSGACLLVRRADAVGAGQLDERFFMYGEDVDFCAAVRARGRRVLFAPEVEITHLRGRSAASAPGATSMAYRRSQIAFYQKHHPRWVPLLRAYLQARGELPDTPISP